MFRLPTQAWVRILGTLEGCIAALCCAWVLATPTTVADRFRIPWAHILISAFGFGFGVAGLRFGNAFGKFAGGLAVALLGGALLLLIYSKGVQEWEFVVEYWQRFP